MVFSAVFSSINSIKKTTDFSEDLSEYITYFNNFDGGNTGNITISPGYIQRTPGTGVNYGGVVWDSQVIQPGTAIDIIWKTPHNSTYKIFGLAESPSTTTQWTHLKYAIWIETRYYIKESGANMSDNDWSSSQSSENWMIRINSNGIVSYYLGNTLLYTSTVTSTTPLQVTAVLVSETHSYFTDVMYDYSLYQQTINPLTFVSNKVISCDINYSGVVTIPNKVNDIYITEIDSNAFKNCTLVTNVIMSSNITTINKDSFMNSGITEIEIPINVTELKKNTFKNCSNLEYIKIKGTINNIASNCFNNTAITTLLSNNNIIWDSNGYQFNDCTNLKFLDLKEGLIEIPPYFMQNTDIECLEIPSTVTSIKNNAFSNCSKLLTIRFKSTIAPTFENDNIFLNSHNEAIIIIPANSSGYNSTISNIPVYELLEFPNSKRFRFQTSDGVIHTSTSDITSFNSNVRNISTNTGTTIGNLVDTNGNSTTSIDIIQLAVGNNITNLYQVNGSNPFSKKLLTARFEAITNTINFGFNGHTDLRYLELPNSFTIVKNWSMGNTPRLQLPFSFKNITKVENDGLKNCQFYKINLENIISLLNRSVISLKILELYIPSTLVELTPDNFSNISNLLKITFSHVNFTSWALDNQFQNLTSLREIIFEEDIPNFGSNTFNNCRQNVKVYYDSSKITNISRITNTALINPILIEING